MRLQFSVSPFSHHSGVKILGKHRHKFRSCSDKSVEVASRFSEHRSLGESFSLSSPPCSEPPQRRRLNHQVGMLNEFLLTIICCASKQQPRKRICAHMRAVNWPKSQRACASPTHGGKARGAFIYFALSHPSSVPNRLSSGHVARRHGHSPPSR